MQDLWHQPVPRVLLVKGAADALGCGKAGVKGAAVGALLRLAGQPSHDGSKGGRQHRGRRTRGTAPWQKNEATAAWRMMDETETRRPRSSGAQTQKLHTPVVPFLFSFFFFKKKKTRIQTLHACMARCYSSLLSSPPCAIPAVRTHPRKESQIFMLHFLPSRTGSILASPSTRLGLPLAAANLTVFVAFIFATPFLWIRTRSWQLPEPTLIFVFCPRGLRTSRTVGLHPGCDARPRQASLRRSAAYASACRAVVDPAAAWRLQRQQHSTARVLGKVRQCVGGKRWSNVGRDGADQGSTVQQRRKVCAAFQYPSSFHSLVEE